VNTATDELRRIADAAWQKDPSGRATAERLQQWVRDTIVIAMTIDVEDYFQVEAFASTVNRSEWERLPRRVEHNSQRLLDILAEAGVKATFFILGWVAERHPALARRVVADGHEVASHGSEHIRVDASRPRAFAPMCAAASGPSKIPAVCASLAIALRHSRSAGAAPGRTPYWPRRATDTVPAFIPSSMISTDARALRALLSLRFQGCSKSRYLPSE